MQTLKTLKTKRVSVDNEEWLDEHLQFINDFSKEGRQLKKEIRIQKNSNSKDILMKIRNR